ncbi:serine/threonine/tyrosine-interacting-like protein 2 [Pristis pectinata]|uniref:serine/threonine/tyrosine-interacting-like protein 2 n=1 Tax=Pristis pectinata TaxID=685728 RepID=UPI00223E29E1|nr:serine/threonine/tyrosine-interacting-like protein 2 [Pristis pectinata]
MAAARSQPEDDPDPSNSSTIRDSGTPSVLELEDILESSRVPLNHVDEVWPNLYIGDLVIAHDRKQLRRLGITHVLNAAHSKWGSKGDAIFYGRKIKYFGITADDCPEFDLSSYFYTAAELIHQTLRNPDAKLLVHCILGLSRSASLLLAYLMIYHERSLLQAVHRMVLFRPISPNCGFLEQLRNLDIELNEKKKQPQGWPVDCQMISPTDTVSHALLSEPTGKALSTASELVNREEQDINSRSNIGSMEGSSHRRRSRSGLQSGTEDDYEPPPMSELQKCLWTRASSSHVDQVWPNLHLGDAWTARDKLMLQHLGITHVLNAADGKFNINTGATYYKDMNIQYYGIEAFDATDFNMSPFFYPAAKFIRAGLNTVGKVFVHCAMGISRAATLVLAFLMICEKMTLVEAIKTVSAHRNISPNYGFLGQLRELDRALIRERRR